MRPIWIEYLQASIDVSRKGDHAQAMTGIELAIAVHQREAKKEKKKPVVYPWVSLAAVAFRAQDIAKAEAALQTACKMDPKTAWIWHDLGVAHLRQKKYKKALEAFKKAHALPTECEIPDQGMRLAEEALSTRADQNQVFARAVAFEPLNTCPREYGANLSRPRR